MFLKRKYKTVGDDQLTRGFLGEYHDKPGAHCSTCVSLRTAGICRTKGWRGRKGADSCRL
jgi:hypothetical protein